MWYLTFSIFISRLYAVKYLLIFAAAVFYIYLGPDGTDEDTYQRYFYLLCNGGRDGTLEPFFQIYNRAFGILGLCEYGAELSLITFYGIFLILVYFAIRTYLNSTDLFYVILILSFYLVTYQLVHNYRTGMASMLAILSFFVFQKHKILATVYAIAAIGFHIQVLPVISLFFFFNLSLKNKLILTLLSSLLIYTVSDFLYIFVIHQALLYIENFSGMYRLSIIPYFFIYIFVIIAADQIKIPNLKYVFYFGFFINLVFIFNAHLSSRMSRVVEPLLMMGLYFALGKFKTKLNAQLRFVISLLPGLAFYGLDRNLIS